MHRHYIVILALLAVLGFVAPVYAEDAGFSRWLDGFREKALAEGISAQTLDNAFANMVPDEEVVALDRRQPESKLTFARYLKNSITPQRIDKAKAMMSEHRELLRGIEKTYGVQPAYIVALWAIESDFGNNKGGFAVLQSLVTLAYEGRRADFFSRELMAALHIVQAESMEPGDLIGSWAGAMGDCQFMPSTYLRYAVDADHDGRRDIWNSPYDIFSSIANYLQSLGWDNRQGWGRSVKLPDDFAQSEADIRHGHKAGHWRKRGLRDAATGNRIAMGDATLYTIYPGTREEGAYLVTENFQSLLKWNRSRYFASAVGMLADAMGD